MCVCTKCPHQIQTNPCSYPAWCVDFVARITLVDSTFEQPLATALAVHPWRGVATRGGRRRRRGTNWRTSQESPSHSTLSGLIAGNDQCVYLIFLLGLYTSNGHCFLKCHWQSLFMRLCLSDYFLSDCMFVVIYRD